MRGLTYLFRKREHKCGEELEIFETADCKDDLTSATLPLQLTVDTCVGIALSRTIQAPKSPPRSTTRLRHA